MFDAIFKNPAIQNALLSRVKSMAKDGTKFLLIDLSNNDVKIEQIKDDRVLIEKETYDFLKKFYDNNKNLKDAII